MKDGFTYNKCRLKHSTSIEPQVTEILQIMDLSLQGSQLQFATRDKSQKWFIANFLSNFTCNLVSVKCFVSQPYQRCYETPPGWGNIYLFLFFSAEGKGEYGDESNTMTRSLLPLPFYQVEPDSGWFWGCEWVLFWCSSLSYWTTLQEAGTRPTPTPSCGYMIHKHYRRSINCAGRTVRSSFLIGPYGPGMPLSGLLTHHQLMLALPLHPTSLAQVEIVPCSIN